MRYAWTGVVLSRSGGGQTSDLAVGSSISWGEQYRHAMRLFDVESKSAQTCFIRLFWVNDGLCSTGPNLALDTAKESIYQQADCETRSGLQAVCSQDSYRPSGIVSPPMGLSVYRSCIQTTRTDLKTAGGMLRGSCSVCWSCCRAHERDRKLCWKSDLGRRQRQDFEPRRRHYRPRLRQ